MSKELVSKLREEAQLMRCSNIDLPDTAELLEYAAEAIEVFMTTEENTAKWAAETNKQLDELLEVLGAKP